jgi:hypothetical protein
MKKAIKTEQLIIPIYLNEKTVIDMLAIIEDGFSIAYSARTAHPFQRNGAPFRFKLSKAQQVD